MCTEMEAFTIGTERTFKTMTELVRCLLFGKICPPSFVIANIKDLSLNP